MTPGVRVSTLSCWRVVCVEGVRRVGQGRVLSWLQSVLPSFLNYVVQTLRASVGIILLFFVF